MLYPDTVEADKLVHKPWFAACILAAAFLIFFAFDLTGTVFGEFMRPAIGEPGDSGLYGRFAVALAVAMLFVANVVLIGFLPLGVQVAVVWVELLILFLSFFYTFDLSFPFIADKVPFMITHFPAHCFITDRLVEEMAVI